MFLITVYGIKVRPKSKKMTDKEEYIHYYIMFFLTKVELELFLMCNEKILKSFGVF